MSGASIRLALTLALLVVPGYLPALALVRRPPWALALAPLATGVVCAAAAIASLVTRTPLATWLAVGIVVATGASAWWLRRAGPSAEADGPVTWSGLAALVAVVAVPLLAVRRAPVDWDARSIWFFHADWVRVGGTEAVDAVSNPALAFAHADYPPLAPATVASVWRVLGHDYELAQLVTALLGASAVVAMALAVRVAVRGLRLPSTVTAAGGVLLILAAYGIAGSGGTNGYVDLLWAAAFAAGTVGLLRSRNEPAAAGAGALCLATAMLTKNEGLIAGAVVLLLVVAMRGLRRGLVLAAAPAGLAAAWVLASRVLGAESDLAASGRLPGLLSLDREVLERIGPTAEAIWRWCRWELVVAAACAGAALAVARRPRSEALGVGPWAVWGAIAGCLGAIALAYVISPNDIEWHLRTSVDRTTVAPRLLLLVEATMSAFVLLSWWRDRAVHPPAWRAAPPPVLPAAHDGADAPSPEAQVALSDRAPAR